MKAKPLSERFIDEGETLVFEEDLTPEQNQELDKEWAKHLRLHPKDEDHSGNR
jgi:hypothetical protein